MSRQITIIEPEKNLCFLKSSEKIDTVSISRRMPRRRLKTISELRLEKELKEKQYVNIAS